ncbi:MAG: glycosyltransferase [Desulfobacterales bacterium]
MTDGKGKIVLHVKREWDELKEDCLKIAMLSIHSDPIGELGSKDTGGMSVYIRELARELGGRGHCIDIYTRLQGDENQSVINLYDNVRLIHLGIPNGGSLSKLALYPYLSKFFRALEDFRMAENLSYDIIHSHYWLSGRLGNWAQNSWNRPHFATFHTLGEVKNRTRTGALEPGFRIAAEKEIVHTCHRILAPTERERDNLIRLYDAPAEKIGVVPCGVNLDLFYPQPKTAAPKTAARKRLALDPAYTILLYVVRYDPLKGLDTLLGAMTYFKIHPLIRLVIVGGDGDKSPEYRALAQKTKWLEIDEKVIFVGRIDQHNLPPYYGAADVLVMPSRYESFGMVGLEALACGRPVVSTPVGAADRLIRKAQAGCIVSDPTPRSLANGIQSVISNRAIPAAEVIRKSILEYSWSNVASAVIAEYENAVNQQFFDNNQRMLAQASS